MHKLQGGEKPVIIFSSRQCQDRDNLLFINRRPNLLNTAVSRAEELFTLGEKIFADSLEDLEDRINRLLFEEL